MYKTKNNKYVNSKYVKEKRNYINRIIVSKNHALASLMKVTIRILEIIYSLTFIHLADTIKVLNNIGRIQGG